MRIDVLFRMKFIHRCSLTLYVENRLFSRGENAFFEGRKLPQKTKWKTLVLTSTTIATVWRICFTFFKVKMKNNSVGSDTRCSYTRLENSTDKTTVKTRWIHGYSLFLSHSVSLSHTHTHTSMHAHKHSYAWQSV